MRKRTYVETKRYLCGKLENAIAKDNLSVVHDTLAALKDLETAFTLTKSYDFIDMMNSYVKEEIGEI